jgi:hypothetical protein
MDKNLLQEFQNRAFQAKTKEEWVNVLTEAKQACVGDENAYNYLKNYFTKILGKKKEYWSKYPPKDKKQYPIKQSYIFQENLANALAEYIQVLTLEKKKQLNID